MEGAGIEQCGGDFASSFSLKKYKVEPNKYLKKLALNKQKKRESATLQRRSGASRKNRKCMYSKGSKQAYGEGSNQSMPELPEALREQLEISWTDKILKCFAERESIELLTREQSKDIFWGLYRPLFATTTIFSKIIKHRPSNKQSSFTNFLKASMSSFAGNFATNHGLNSEAKAKQKFEELTQKRIQPCGLVISEELYFVASSPDGLIEEENSFVEIKSPFYPKKKFPINERPASVREAIEKKLGSIPTFLEISDGAIHLKPKHEYMTQVQGQMAVGNKEHCWFIVYLAQEDEFIDIFYEKIDRDPLFWPMFRPKIIDYYLGVKWPNLVEGRNSANLIKYNKDWKLTNQTRKLFSDRFLASNPHYLPQ